VDTLGPTVQHSKNQVRAGVRHSNQRGGAGQLGGAHHILGIHGILRAVLHIDDYEAKPDKSHNFRQFSRWDIDETGDYGLIVGKLSLEIISPHQPASSSLQRTTALQSSHFHPYSPRLAGFHGLMNELHATQAVINGRKLVLLRSHGMPIDILSYGYRNIAVDGSKRLKKPFRMPWGDSRICSGYVREIALAP